MVIIGDRAPLPLPIEKEASTVLGLARRKSAGPSQRRPEKSLSLHLYPGCCTMCLHKDQTRADCFLSLDLGVTSSARGNSALSPSIETLGNSSRDPADLHALEATSSSALPSSRTALVSQLLQDLIRGLGPSCFLLLLSLHLCRLLLHVQCGMLHVCSQGALTVHLEQQNLRVSFHSPGLDGSLF